MHKKEQRAISRKRKREDEEFEAQMISMEEELGNRNPILLMTQEMMKYVIRKLKLNTREIYQLTFLMKGISPMMMIKFLTTLVYQIERYC